ncbi:hypothetical protein [Edaphovirga cremea]|uniref:hypothetical protein n=1 Tax=Edaphovirga cremea TaxID=2267246 RepID=UPI000DF01E22|nr:hypothetical protein [Edaphovirga cremea]
MMLHIFLMLLISVGLQLLGLLAFSWEILESGGSKLVLGINLSLVALVPFLLKKVKIINSYMKYKTRQLLFVLSLVGTSFTLIFAVVNVHESHISYLLVASFIYSTITSLLVQSTEQLNLYCKIKGGVNASQSSKLSNYASQLGSIVFALLFGFVIHNYGFSELLYLCSFSMLSLSILSYSCDIADVNNAAISPDRKFDSNSAENYQIDIFLLLSLAVVNAVVTFVLILIMNTTPNFDVLTLGIADALAGVGAMVGIYVASKLRLVKRIILLIALVVSQLTLVSSLSEVLIYISIFAWGGALNGIRYQVRTSLNSKVDSYNGALEVSLYLVNGTVLVNALVPLILAVSLKIITAFEMMVVISLLLVVIFLLPKRSCK